MMVFQMAFRESGKMKKDTGDQGDLLNGDLSCKQTRLSCFFQAGLFLHLSFEVIRSIVNIHQHCSPLWNQQLF